MLYCISDTDSCAYYSWISVFDIQMHELGKLRDSEMEMIININKGNDLIINKQYII